MLGTNTGATSYHLRQLAEVGLVAEDAGAGHGRERWWRAAHDVTSWERDNFAGDPDAQAASDWLTSNFAHQLAERIEDWNAGVADEPEAWRSAAVFSDYIMRLGPDQLTAMLGELDAVIERWRAAEPGAGRPPGPALPLSRADAPIGGVVSALTETQVRRRFLFLLGLRWFPVGLMIPVLVLLPLERGLTIAQFGAAAAAQGLIVLFLELPTGGLSDAIGRRPVLLLAGLLNLASLTVLSVGELGGAVRRGVPAPGRLPGAGQRSARGLVRRPRPGRRPGRGHRDRAEPQRRRPRAVHRRGGPGRRRDRRARADRAGDGADRTGAGRPGSAGWPAWSRWRR